MKRSVYLILPVLLLAISCENEDENTFLSNPKNIRLEAYTEKVAVSADDSLNISWKRGDAMSVFDERSRAVTLSTNANSSTKNVFYSYDWNEGATPEYALFPASDDAACTADGVLTLTVPSEQRVSTTGTLEHHIAVGRIVGNRTSYQISPMRNVTGHITLAFSLDNPGVKSVRIASVGGEPVTGRVSVNCDAFLSGDDDYLTVVDGQTSVTLTPAQENGSLVSGTYYAALLPGRYEQGFNITLTLDNGATFEKVYMPDGVTIARSAISSFCGEPAADDNLPDDVRIDLDFSKGWPFKEAIVPVEQQIASGYANDAYTYVLGSDIDGVQYQRNLPFAFKANNCEYTRGDKNDRLLPGTAAYFYLTLPAMPGRYIRALKVESLNGAANPKNVRLRRVLDMADLVKDVKTWADNPAIISFPMTDGRQTMVGESYRLYFDTANTHVKNISIIYSRELPEVGEYDPFTEDVPTVEPEIESLEVTVDFASEWPFEEACVAVENQNADHDKYTYVHSYEHEGASKTIDLTFTLGCSATWSTSRVYSHDDIPESSGKGLYFHGTHGGIILPGVSGMYLSSVSVSLAHYNGTEDGVRFAIQEGCVGMGDGKDGNRKLNATRFVSGQECVFNLPVTDASPAPLESVAGKPYVIQVRDGGGYIGKVKVIYTKTRPE